MRFAQIREAYILAGQLAFDRGGDLTPDDLVEAASHMRREGRRITASVDGRAVGFALDESKPANVGLRN